MEHDIYIQLLKDYITGRYSDVSSEANLYAMAVKDVENCFRIIEGHENHAEKEIRDIFQEYFNDFKVQRTFVMWYELKKFKKSITRIWHPIFTKRIKLK